MFDKSHSSNIFKSKVSCDIFKTKWMSTDISILHLNCHLNVTCLVIRVNLISEVSIDVWFFLFRSHTSCQILNRTYQLTCILFLCKFLHVKCQKLAKTLSKIHTGNGSYVRWPLNWYFLDPTSETDTVLICIFLEAHRY